MCIVATKEDDDQVAKKDKTSVYQIQSWNEYEDKTIAEMLNSTQVVFYPDNSLYIVCHMCSLLTFSFNIIFQFVCILTDWEMQSCVYN